MYLQKIIEHKKEEIKNMPSVENRRTRKVLDAYTSLKDKPFICEIKKASPSMGDINLEVNIIEQAKSYETAGGGAISVLTDKKFFKGDLEFLTETATNVSIPVLCKDFIISELQIENAYNAGADFILLIVAILSKDELTMLSRKAHSLNLQVLYEIHNYEEFDKIKHLELQLVGVNSRDLTTFEIKKDYACSVINQLTGNFIRVAESGINNTNDISQFVTGGAEAFLIGTALMQSDNPADKLKEFYNAI